MWIKFKDTKNINTIINTNAIAYVQYLPNSNLTIIEYTRAAFPAIYVNGNHLAEITRKLQLDDEVVTELAQ